MDEYIGDYNELVYLRARFYEPGTGRFLTRDPWEGNEKQPMSLNSWLYTYGNPVNHSDPSGYISCENSNDAACIQKATELKAKGDTIKMQVTNGSLLPVEGFAQFADIAYSLFDQDIRGTMWALTITLDGFDANQGSVWNQAFTGGSSPFWLGFDWLPYDHNPDYDVQNWDGNRPWIHSRRGDWRTEYWDKTANQAYHFWYFTAVTFFDGRGFANAANVGHEVLQNPTTLWQDISQLKDWEAPAVAGKTKEDWTLSFAGMSLGERLKADQLVYFYTHSGIICDPEHYPNLFSHLYTKPGTWIRSNLK
jgi:RHS repeat-associated protein